MSNKKSKYPVLQVDLRLESVMTCILVITTRNSLKHIDCVEKLLKSRTKCYLSGLISVVHDESILLDYGMRYFNDVLVLEDILVKMTNHIILFPSFCAFLFFMWKNKWV